MKYASLVVSCACLLLLQLEMGAARATGSGPSESLYATARELGLDAAGLDEIWRTRKPLVITNANGPNEVTTVTYVLSPNGSRITKTVSYKSSHRSSWGQPLPPISEAESLFSSFFLNPFLNPFGSGFAQSFFEALAVPKGVYENRVATATSTYTKNTNAGPGVPAPDRNPFLPGLQGSQGPLNPNYRPTRPPFRDNVNERNPNERNLNERNPNERNPNERNPNERNPNERNPNTPNLNDFNPNDPLWGPEPEATTRRTVVPLPTLAPTNNDTVIDDFLKKFDVTTSDIKEEDGEYVRTIVDTNGRILNAKFELIDTKNEGGKSSTK